MISQGIIDGYFNKSYNPKYISKLLGVSRKLVWNTIKFY